ncbi:MAG: SMC-Scp complex subunit ScpB [Gammaproteobacteria bacterium]|nr:MAG: SMC-Scp complex subunit ScpB [Gammaproteobacteria bacterium]
MDTPELKYIVEAALHAAGRPLTIDHILGLFENDVPSRDDIRRVFDELNQDYQERGIEIVRVSSGYRLQVKKELAPWVSHLWDEKPARYTRALLETLALIAYRQPITRGEIEDVRGVSVSTNIIKTLMEREWVRVLGHRDVPGKPAMYGTTKEFLDYFNLKSLGDLPTLQELRDIESINAELDLDGGVQENGDKQAIDSPDEVEPDDDVADTRDEPVEEETQDHEATESEQVT